MRTIEQIKEEYAALCQKAGHLQYQIFIFEKDLEMVNSSLRDLNLEAAKVQREADEKEKAV